MAVLIWACPARAVLDDKIFTSSGQILPGEEWDIVNIYNDDTVVDMLGGSADWIATHDGSTLNVVGGIGDIEAADTSSINVHGGEIGYIRGVNGARINFFDSDHAAALAAEDLAQISITGGTVGNLHAYGTGVINLYGGIVLGDIVAGDLSAVNIYGYALVKTDVGGAHGYGEVSGFLMDGTYFATDFFNAEACSHVNIVPEPSCVGFLVAGVLLLRRRK